MCHDDGDDIHLEDGIQEIVHIISYHTLSHCLVALPCRTVLSNSVPSHPIPSLSRTCHDINPP